MHDTTESPAASSEGTKFALSQVEESACSQCGMPDRRVSLNSVLSIISGLRADVNALRNKSGDHRCPEDKGKRESWFVTAGKMLALRFAEDAIKSLPAVSTESDALLFQKLNSSLFRDWLVSRRDALAADYAEDDLFSSVAEVRSDARRSDAAVLILDEAITAFDSLGNAGEQPKDKEKEPESIGRPPVTTPAQPPRLADLAALLPGLNQRLTRHHLTSISEWCLDRLEEMEPVRWSPDAGAVGEGGMGFED